MTPRLSTAVMACLLAGALTPATVSQAADAPPGNAAAGARVTVYRNDTGHSGYTDAPMPTPLSLIWRHTGAYAKGNPASPVYADGVVYFGAGPNVYAVNAADGALRWQFPASGAATANFESTPALDNGGLYIGGDDSQMYKLDAKTGAQVWVKKVGGTVRSSPVVGGGLVFFGSTDRQCYAVSADTGQSVWATPTQGAITASPTLSGGQVVFASSDNILYSLNAANGKSAWSVHLPSDPSASPPVLSEGNLYVGAGSSLFSLNGRGTTRWQRDLQSGLVTPPTVGGGNVYVVTQDRKVHALSDRGRPRWTANIDYLTNAAPLLAGNVLLVPTQHGILYGFDAQSGALRWEYVVQAVGTKTQPKYQSTDVTSAPIWAAGTLYVQSDDGTVSAFRADAVDKVAPQIADMSPAPGAVVAGVRIPYGARVYDDGSGIDPASVTFLVDNSPASLVKYMPSYNGVYIDLTKDVQGFSNRPAADGLHQITLQARDWRGNVLTRNWAFTVDNSLDPPGTPPAPAAVMMPAPPPLLGSGVGTLPPTSAPVNVVPGPGGGGPGQTDGAGGVNGGPPPPPPLDLPPPGGGGGNPTPPPPGGGGGNPTPPPPGGGGGLPPPPGVPGPPPAPG